MLKGVFSLDNPVMRFLSKVADVMVLNLLFIVCSIPVFTIGAALSALYYCLFKIKDEEEGYLVKKFFHSFKQNIRQASVMWLIMLLFFAVLFLEFMMYREVDGTMGQVVRSIVLIGLIFWYLIGTYAFALQAKFYNTIRGTFTNAVLLMFANGPRSVGIIGLTAAAVIFTLMQKDAIIVWNLILLWILFGFAAIATINVQFLYPVIQKLIPEEEKEEATPDNAFTVNEETDLSALGYDPSPARSEEAPEGASSAPEEAQKEALSTPEEERKEASSAPEEERKKASSAPEEEQKEVPVP